MKVAIIGYGKVGKAYHKVFPDAVIYDEPQSLFGAYDKPSDWVLGSPAISELSIEQARKQVHECDIALVCVPTDLKDGKLDVSIVEEVVGWLETDLILIKSALWPGTVDRLVKKTGKKIAVSIEYVGEGTYKTHFWKYPHQNDPRLHQMIVVGGENKVAEACAEVLWDKMSPDVRITLGTALEVEIGKLIENFYGALKVTFINCFKSLADGAGGNFVRMHQAWQSDPRVDSMHLRTVSYKRGWKSKCWDKDIVALATYAKSIGAKDMNELVETVVKLNEGHYALNQAKN